MDYYVYIDCKSATTGMEVTLRLDAIIAWEAEVEGDEIVRLGQAAPINQRHQDKVRVHLTTRTECVVLESHAEFSRRIDTARDALDERRYRPKFSRGGPIGDRVNVGDCPG